MIERRDPVPGAGRRPRIAVSAVSAALLTAAWALPASAQEAGTDSAGAEAETAGGGPERIGAFAFAIQGGEDERPETRLLVVPDTGSSLSEGARLFLRCRGDQREVYVAVSAGNLGDAREGAGGQWRFDRRPWSELTRWGANEEGTAAFMPPRLYDTFVARALEYEVVEIRIVNTAGVRKRFVFPLGGFEEGHGRLGCFDGEED